jgi:hypothetical protein
VAGTAPATAAPGTPARAVATTPTPLRVSIETLTPSVVPTRGTVKVTGEVTNTTDATWRDLHVYMLTSATPMTSAEELAAAARTDPASEIGSRLITPGLYDKVGDLGPGQSVRYTVQVPVKQLGIGSAPGVYWLGVHVLGQDPAGGRDGVADGRARTFIPLVPPGTPARRLALVMPVTAPVRRDRDGHLLGLAAWRRTLAPDGRLDRLIRLSSTSSGQALTWLLDPAVLDAARSVADGNPAYSVAPTDGTPDPAASASPSPSASASTSPSAGSSPGATSGGSSSGTSGQAGTDKVDAENWLQLLERQAPSHAVLGLPYGALDVGAALDRRQRAVYATARQLSQRTLDDAGIDATPVVAPASGLLPGTALRKLGPGVDVLLGDRAFPTATTGVLAAAAGARVALSDQAAADGGPSPGDRWSALAMRQRILSEAAIQALTPGPRLPIVVRTPQQWDPGHAWAKAHFFDGLDVPWLRPTDLRSVLDRPASPPAATRPFWPRRMARTEVPFANLLATDELVGTGATFAGLLTRNDTVDDALARIAMLGSSEYARRRPDPALARVRATTGQVRHDMQEIHVEGPRFVTMSSADGPIQVTVVNGLDEEVTVAVRAETGTRDVTIADSDPVTLGPGKRASLRLPAHARDIGVHSVTLQATNAAGEPLGSTTRITVRTSQVGLVIWAIMAVGGAVLVAAIVMRTVRRVRARRAARRRDDTTPDETGSPAPVEEQA